MKNKTIIIGCGRLGSSIANHASSKGESVIVVDSDKASFEKLSDIFSGYRIVSDATSESELIDAGIESAKEVIITTGDDNVNLFLAHVCYSRFHVPEIYVRFDDPDKGLLVNGMDIKAIYPFQLSRDRFNFLKQGDGK